MIDPSDDPSDDLSSKEPGEALASEEGQQSLVSSSLSKALIAARDRLLDRSLRNKLINTPLTSSKARQVRVFDELSDAVFPILRSGRAMTFVPSRAGSSVDEEGYEDGQHIWTPDDDGGDASGKRAERHSDTKLQTKLTPEGLQKRLLSLFYEGQTLEEEQGVNVLFLALGFLEWREAKQSEISRFAPLILLPVDLQRDGAKDRFKLRIREEDLITNVSLQAWLKDQFGLDLPDLPEQDDWTPSGYFEAVSTAIGSRRGWAVHADEMTLGFFSFAKFLLWRDLDPESWPDGALLSDNPLLKAVLLRDDDSSAIEDVPLIGPDERIDEVFQPAELIHVTDADSSQAIAIQEALSGKNLVIQGPPGTGKSQTITNIIAGAVHGGKSVLFIAEKMAALEVVHERLVKQKLGPICLELHSRKSSKAQVLQQIKEGRNAPVPPYWPSSTLDQLTRAQTSLRAYSDRMHDAEAGFSAFELMGRISLLKAEGAPAPTFQLPDASKWSRQQLDAARIRADRFAERLALAGVPCSHPWRGMGANAPDMLEQERLKPLVTAVLEQADRLTRAVDAAGRVLGLDPEVRLSELDYWCEALGLIGSRPAGVDNVLVAAGLPDARDHLLRAVAEGRSLAELRSRLESIFRADAWSEDWTTVRRSIAGHGRSLLRIFSGHYREAIAQLRGVWNGDLPKVHTARLAALDDLIDAQSAARALSDLGAALDPLIGPLWKGERSDWSLLQSVADWTKRAAALPSGLDIRQAHVLVDPVEANRLQLDLSHAQRDAKAAVERLCLTLEMDVAICLDGSALEEVTASDLVALAKRWTNHFIDIAQWPAIRDDLDWLRSIGCDVLADQAFIGSVTASQVRPVLLLAAYEALWGAVRQRDPEIEKSNGVELDQTVRRFRKADHDRISLASDEVARAHIDRHPTGNAGAVGVLLDETKKSRNLKPVRKLMVEAGDAIQRFKPVFLMSPLSVAQYLTPGLIEFDMLVIDEASQVRPEDALGAIARCKQLIVVGDDKQLPPTSFFSRMINDEPELDEDDVSVGRTRSVSVKDVESILNLCSRFPERMLRWHYRSEHPALIATSNRNFYKGELMLPPSVVAKAHDGKTGLMFHQTEPGHYERGKTARNEKEADDVAHAVLQHARECPELSLGIGTFSVAQRDCVRDRLDDLARKHPELDDFMKGQAGRETVFVKNLENIQGDERDVIYISVGYGRDANGKLTQNFGPVGRDGGERRLNVLITRARKRCEVFSSLVAEDILFEGIGKPGVRALKEFLKLAKDGYSAFAEHTERGFDSDFEEAVAHAIREIGYDCRPQVGMAGFFIDLAVLDPRNPDRYLLGVECDGAAYHSSRYARDRDRLRQEILERRGWAIHRIWSTDWFYRRDREIEKLRLAIEAALEGGPATALPAIDEPFDVPEPEATHVSEPPGWSGIGEEPASPARMVKPYEFAEFRVAGAPVKPQDRSLADVARWVTSIVEVEQPIHQDEVGRRLAACCGWQRAGPVIQEYAHKALLFASRDGGLIVDRDFWCIEDGQDIVPRDRSQLHASETVRKPDMISPIEFAAAAIHALEENLALPMDELVVEAARVLGFARVGKDIDAAVRSAINTDLMNYITTDHLGRLRLTE